MRIALGLTAVMDGAAPGGARAAGLPSGGDSGDAPRTASAGAQGLFAGLIVPARPRQRSRRACLVSGVAHVVLLGALVLVPPFLPEPPPSSADFIRVLIYDPPPAPPPPLPRGNPLLPEGARPRPARAEPRPEPIAPVEVPRLVAPIETPPSPPESGAESANAGVGQAGTPTGSESGVPEGMEGGVEGGLVGGVPGGVLGGVIGGTGQGPVLDVDVPPRLVRQARPRYPQEAFVKKVEGKVMVELVIDANGRVVSVRVIRSVPLLDEAALEAVRQWIFTPALKHGVPVATIAHAPVAFRIF